MLKFTGPRVTMGDPKERLKAAKQGDEWSIASDGYEYSTKPEAVISGG